MSNIVAFDAPEGYLILEAETDRALEELVDCLDDHLAAMAPEIPPAERRVFAREVARRLRPDEGAAEACRRFARDSIRAAVKDDLRATRLNPGVDKNDVGNGERFAEHHAERFKFLEDRKIWRRWDGKRWKDATESDVCRAAKLTAKRMLATAFEKPESDSKEERQHALASLSRRAIGSMIDLAASEEVFSAQSSQFDVDPDLICVENGILNLRTGVLSPHERDSMITTLTRIKYDPEAKSPRWEQFMREIFCDDWELIDFVQRAVGYSMTGHTREHAFFILFGGGRNGKGRFITQLRALLGDAARTTRFQTFTNQRDEAGGNTPALANLAGARLVAAGEPDQGVKLSESTIKLLTGEDEIEVCRKYEHPFMLVPQFKLWLHCNYKPVIRGTDEGIWSRPRLIPFNVSFVSREEAEKKGISEERRRDPDRKLDAKLNAERAGILAWAVRGAMKWYIDGLGKSRTMANATDEYRVESDQLGPFVDDCLRREAGKFTTNEQLCQAYEMWCRRNLVDHVMPGQTLSKQLVARGFERGKNQNDVRGFVDVRVLQAPNLFAVPSGPQMTVVKPSKKDDDNKTEDSNRPQ